MLQIPQKGREYLSAKTVELMVTKISKFFHTLNRPTPSADRTYDVGVPMQRVLLSCNSIDDARFLKTYIESELPYEVFLAFQQAEIEASLKAKSIHLLILQSGNQVKQDLGYALALRNHGYSHPIMMITDTVGAANIEE